MIRRDAEGVNLDVVVLGGPAEHAEDAFVGLGSWTQQRAAVDRSGAGFDQTPSTGDVAERAWS